MTSALQGVNRTLYLVSLGAFFLPFATVKGCASDEPKTYTGVEMIGQTGGGFLIGTILIAVLLLALSFRSRVLPAARRGLHEALRALACALAGFLVMLSTGLTFLLYRETERSGYIICVACWWVLYILSLGRAFGHLDGRRHVLGTVVGATMLATHLAVLRSGPGDVQDLVLDVLLLIVFSVPAALAARFWLAGRRIVDADRT